MLRFLFFQVAVIGAALPVISQFPPTWPGGSLAVMASAVAQPVLAQTITVLDPVGDTTLNAPAFQDIVLGQMTKTASGNFEVVMEMAGPVPVAPPLPQLGVKTIWWICAFELDPTTVPHGYPFAANGHAGEFLVVVSWNGTAFAGTAIDRRPLLTGGEAIITPVPFSINGTTLAAVLDSTLIANVPQSFVWRLRTFNWTGPVGSDGLHQVDRSADSVLGP